MIHATPGSDPAPYTALPWTTLEDGRSRVKLVHVETTHDNEAGAGLPVCSIPSKRIADAEYLVHAANEYPRLVAEIARLRAQSESAPIPAGRRRVVCAAVRSADGLLLLGIRHYSQDMHQQIAEREDGNKFSHRNDDDQGFVDQHGEFMTREEAYKVAEAAGQIIRPEACGEGRNGPKLYSEGIY